MTQTRALHPVLLIGGAGVVGSHTTRTLRRLQPELPLWIGGRDLAKAQALAQQAGAASAVRVDLTRPDLGLGPAPVAAVVCLLNDDSLNALRFAQDRGVPCILFSNWQFEIAPQIAQYMQRPAAAPVVLLGHLLGGTVSATTLFLARGMQRVRSIAIGLVIDSDDGGGPATHGDFERISEQAPHPLLRIDGQWTWVHDERAQRRFVDASGHEREGRALPLLDVPSLAAATGAASVRVDFAVRDAARRPAGSGPSHSLVIEIEGESDGRRVLSRGVMLGEGGHSLTSAYGAALAIESCLGLRGGSALPAGLYSPDTLFDPAGVVRQLRELGVHIEQR